MARFGRSVLAACSLIVSTACGNASPAPGSCAQVSQPIFGGTTDGGTLETVTAVRSALVEIDTTSDTSRCTGTIVAPGRVLTAAHCELQQGLLIRAPLEGWEAPSRRFIAHPQLDAMVIEFDAEANAPSGLLPVSMTVADASLVGKQVRMAGFGRDESDGKGVLRFVDESIADVGPNEIWVDGKGVTGACDGDSGGPLLAKDDGGRMSVIGVLSRGSSSCRGKDVYVPTAALQPWLSRALTREPCDVSVR